MGEFGGGGKKRGNRTQIRTTLPDAGCHVHGRRGHALARPIMATQAWHTAPEFLDVTNR